MPDSYAHVPESMRKLSEAVPRDVMRHLLSDTFARVMRTEVETLCNAAYGSRSGARENSRNGYRERDLETRMGTVSLSIPTLRRGSYVPSFLEPRRRWKKAIVQVVSEAYVLGVSTCKVEEGPRGGDGGEGHEPERGVPHGGVPRRVVPSLPGAYPREGLPPRLARRPYVKVREGGRTVSKAVLVASSERMECWKAFLEGLVKRKLRGVKLVISDAHAGPRGATRDVLNETVWQSCTVTFWQSFSVVASRMAFMRSSLAEARELDHKAIALIEVKQPRVAECARNAEEDVLAHLTFPQAQWQIRSTNLLERLNKEFHRRTDVVGIFPSDDTPSCAS